MMQLSDTDKNKLIEWNQTDCEYDSNICIHHKLEYNAINSPNNKALSYRGQVISYSKLNTLANAVANILIDHNIKTEDFVIVHLDRRIELIASIFGVLKSGGVYVPISAEYPTERMNNILSDTKAKLVITSKSLANNLPENQEIILIDDLIEDIDILNTIQPQIDVKATNLAYAIFTSGTTGKPKGVLIEHHSVINRISWMQKSYPIDQNDTLLQKTTITFDVSVWELFWASFEGAKLVLLENGDEKIPENILSCIDREKISVMHFVPSMFNTFLKQLGANYPKNQLKSLKWVFCSGEELHRSSAKEFYRINSSLENTCTLINLYGPTEATVDVTYHTCLRGTNGKIPIGKAIDNTQIYVVNENNEIMPPNTDGELVICGVNLAREYLNCEKLTNEKFITLNVFGKLTRAYKTGDVVCYSDKGEIIYKGRKDKQIKLRGYRIELAEIENSILSFDNVGECACVVKDELLDTAHIAAFIVAKNTNSEVSVEALKDYLSSSLPAYMLPNVFVPVTELPLSPSGKINNKELLNQLEKRISSMVSPFKQTGNEKELSKLWAKLLKRSSINPLTNFFELGGNSLKIAQLSVLIKKEFNKDVNPITLMQYPTIRTLSQHLFAN